VSVEDRVRRGLERLSPADPSGAYERVVEKRARHRTVRRAEAVLLGCAVVVGSVAGFLELAEIFRQDTRVVVGGTSPFPIAPHGNGRIVFADGDELATIEPDGSDRQTIPTPQGGPWFASWSPDGTKLAVTLFPNGEGDRTILVMNADGSDPVQIASADNVSAASWSPDGTQIAYAATGGGSTSVHIVRADGGGDTLVHLEEASGTHEIFSASFSPDGTEILFDAGTDSGFDIFVMRVDGSNVRQITTTGTDYDPAWSPDGSEIAFARQGSGLQSDIYLMDADGTHVVQLTDDGEGHTNLGATWSPDGTKIAFEAGRNGGPGPLDVVDADGATRTTLVRGEVIGIGWQAIPAEQVSNSPTPIAPGGRDLGLGFPVCHVSAIHARFADSHTRQTGYVAAKVDDGGACPQPEDAFEVVAIDLNGDGHADASYGPIACVLECRVFSAPDIDGDGTAELLVVQQGGTVVGLGLFDVHLGGPGADVAIQPVEVAPPGDPGGGFEPDTPAVLWLGGDAFELYALRCGELPDPGGPGLVATAAESRPHDSPDASWLAHEVTFALRDGSLHVVGLRDFTEPVEASPSFVSGETLCGSNLGP
jgi:hypothetical protein